jgi:hypothetical protein
MGSGFMMDGIRVRDGWGQGSCLSVMMGKVRGFDGWS